MKNSKIEWTHHTFNPWWGCVKVSPACEHCYAEAFAKRTGHDVWGPDKPRRFFGDKHWNEPLGWNDRPLVCPNGSTSMPGAPGGHGPYCASSCANDKECPECGARLEHARVFCASMADIFEDYTGPDADKLKQARVRLFDLIRQTPNLDWLLLTKRPENWHDQVLDALATEEKVEGDWPSRDPETELGHWLNDWIAGEPPSNVWFGTTVENQEQANKRIPELLKVPARVRFLSMEPLLENVKLPTCTGAALCPFEGIDGHSDHPFGGIHWIICGGESGPGSRPMNSEWARSLRDQCGEAKASFFFKHWGEWLPHGQGFCDTYHEQRIIDPTTGEKSSIPQHGTSNLVYRIGKSKAGRLLDGKEWNEVPQ